MTPDNPQYYDVMVGNDGRPIPPFDGPDCVACGEPSAPYMREIDGLWFHEDCTDNLEVCTGCGKFMASESVPDENGDPWHPACKQEGQ